MASVASSSGIFDPAVTSGSTKPVWYDTVKDLPKFEPLKADAQCDVAVIGGGISGLSCAYKLLKAGQKVIVLDDGEIASGETGRTTAHLMSYQDDHFHNIIHHHGVDAARTAFESHAAAIDLIEQIIRDEGIDCDFQRVSGYLIPDPYDPAAGEKEVLKEYEAAGQIKVPGAEIVDRAPTPIGNTGRALRMPNQGQFNILKYMRGLANAIVKMGGVIHTNTHAHDVQGGKEFCTVPTNRNATITSKHMIIATNIPVNDRFVMQTKHEPMRSYAVGFKVAKGSVPRALVWDTHDPYFYARVIDGPGEADTLVVGGQDELSGQHQDFEQRFDKIIEWTQKFYPVDKGTIVYRWSGHIVEPIDDMAFIGRNPQDYPNVYIVTCDSGQGMTHGTIAGIMLTDMILGRTSPWEKLYDPARQMTSEMTEFIKHNIQVQAQFKDYVKLPHPCVTDIEEIVPGSGALMRKGALDIRAVYKDETGKVHQCSAKCPHLGCIVHWNNLEKSWDCPCHGSRFDRYGTVVDGPSNKNLEPIQQ